MLCDSALYGSAEGDVLNRKRSIAEWPKRRALPLAAALLAMAAVTAAAETCTTQARMPQAMRGGLADTALMLGSAVKADNADAVKAATVAEYANNFGPIEYVIRSTSDKLKGDTLRVTQVYELDASMRQAGDTSEADFTCPLKGTTAETDFSISSLPAGVYGFAMVEAAGGAHPWLLSFLLQQDGGGWKMAGFYPHARTAVGKDGLWYWTAARERVQAKQPWLAWMDYDEADELLRPAGFVSSTELDRLRAERHSAAPQALSDGISAQTPLTVKGVGGLAFHFTSMANETSTDDGSLHLVLHYAGVALAGAEANRMRDAAAAEAMINGHPELRQGYSAVIVFADIPGQNPSVLSLPMAEIP